MITAKSDNSQKDADTAPGGTLAKAAARALNRTPERRAIEFGGRWINYNELAEIADRVAELIRESGADPRAPVAFAPRNRPSALAALMGLIAEARNIRMMYAYQSGESLARNFARINASALIAAADDFSPEVIEELRKEGCAGIGLTETGAEFVAGLVRVTKQTDPSAPETPTFEMLTSGTTGPAKLWPLSYGLLEQRFVRANSVFDEDLLRDPVPTLLCYPLCNISGLYSALPSMLAGMPIVLQDRFTLEGWLDYVRRYRPPEIYMPPVGIQMLLDANVPPEDLASAKCCRSGMTGLPVELHRAFEERYNMPILLSYGATEFGGVVVQMGMDDVAKWGRAKLGSVGRAFGEAKVRVTDVDSREVLPPGKEGLLEVFVPSIFPNWARTSDIAMIDQDEFVYILGRADGAIMRGGFKILPETVESALLQHPNVEAAAVVGVKDRRLGQVPAAVIELKKGGVQPSVEELERHVRRHVPSTHVPVTWRFVAQMPRTASLKVDRGSIKELMAKEYR